MNVEQVKKRNTRELIYKSTYTERKVNQSFWILITADHVNFNFQRFFQFKQKKYLTDEVVLDFILASNVCESLKFCVSA